MGYPKEGWSVIGWSSDQIGALEMALAITRAPSCSAVEVFDRLDRVTVAFFGV